MTIEHLPLLYSFRRCPYAMRARLALMASGLRVELREIVLRNKPAHMLQISPKGTVPVLLLPNHQVLEESLDIMLWALRQSDPMGLLPHDQAQLDRVLELIKTNDGAFKHGLDRYKYPPRYPEEHAAFSPEQFALHHRDAAAQVLIELDQRLKKQTYLVANHLTLADFAIAPFVRQYAHTDLTWFQAQDWPHLLQWFQQFIASDIFHAVMHKYPAWQEGDERVVFPPLQ
ncbi:glutathione S-transferase [Paenalcaligenes faecalis]|uniref:glutathione S-transferase n=1 Tax=Paenalcaligenes faecalis TaxID=2980099 RepID=UPI0022B97DC1|nr:glutathione S-transferase [Paenalcaligenes faecalis]